MSTTREVAERIVATLLYGSHADYDRDRNEAVTEAIDEALQAERERAARIIKEHREADRCEGSCWEIITTAIREGQPR